MVAHRLCAVFGDVEMEFVDLFEFKEPKFAWLRYNLPGCCMFGSRPGRCCNGTPA